MESPFQVGDVVRVSDKWRGRTRGFLSREDDLYVVEVDASGKYGPGVRVDAELSIDSFRIPGLFELVSRGGPW